MNLTEAISLSVDGQQFKNKRGKTMDCISGATLYAEPWLKELPMFAGLTAHQRGALMKCAYLIRCEPGETLFNEGDPADGFFILRLGRVKMRKISTTGHEVVLHLSSPPHMIGCKALTLPGSSYPADAVAVDQVEALRFTRARFLATVKEIPDVFFGLLIDMNRRLSEIYTLQSSLLEPVQQRIATLLLQQALPINASLNIWEEHPLQEIRLTKSLIASIVGTTTETAIRILSKWKKNGFIDSERGVIRITNGEAIFELSGGMAN